MISPGEIYWADFGRVGRHPIIVVSRASLNRGSHVLGVYCTSQNFAARQLLPNCVPFKDGDFGFTSDCVAQCEHTFSIEITRIDLVSGPVGKLDDLTLRDVIKAIGYVIESDCEPV